MVGSHCCRWFLIHRSSEIILAAYEYAHVSSSDAPMCVCIGSQRFAEVDVVGNFTAPRATQVIFQLRKLSDTLCDFGLSLLFSECTFKQCFALAFFCSCLVFVCWLIVLLFFFLFSLFSRCTLLEAWADSHDQTSRRPTSHAKARKKGLPSRTFVARPPA